MFIQIYPQWKTNITQSYHFCQDLKLCQLHLHQWNASHPSPRRYLSYTSIIFHHCSHINQKTNKYAHTCKHTYTSLGWKCILYLNSETLTHTEKKHTLHIKWRLLTHGSHSVRQLYPSFVRVQSQQPSPTSGWILH